MLVRAEKSKANVGNTREQISPGRSPAFKLKSCPEQHNVQITYEVTGEERGSQDRDRENERARDRQVRLRRQFQGILTWSAEGQDDDDDMARARMHNRPASCQIFATLQASFFLRGSRVLVLAVPRVIVNFDKTGRTQSL